MRVRCWLLTSVLAAGCASGLDESRLTAGSGPSSDAPDLGGAADLGGAPTTPPTTTPTPTCEDFASVGVGERPPQWNEERGNWRVALDGSVKVLRQEWTGGQSPRYIAWSGQTSWRDLEVSARVTAASAPSDECLLFRYQAPDSFYALCIDSDESGGGRYGGGGTTTRQWQLHRAEPSGGSGGDGLTLLASGNFLDSSVATHVFGVVLAGTSITPIVDGIAQTKVTDSTWSRGAIGLLTEGRGMFTRVCVSVP